MRGVLARGRLEISERLLVDGEEAACGAVFRRHVGDGGAVLQRQVIQPFAIELHELADDAFPPQHLRHGQYEVGGGDAFAKRAGDLEANDFRDQHGDRLAEHRRFRLDAAHAPAEHREPVDHGGVAVRADQRVRERELRLAVLLLGPHRLGEIFEIDLVADAGARRHHAEIVERARAPAQERVALAVPLILLVDVDLERHAGAERIDHHRVIDDEIDGRQRIDLVRVAPQRRDRVAHGGKIDHGRDAGEILHQDPRGTEGDLPVASLLLQPVRDGADIVGRDSPAVLMAQQVLEQHFEGERQPADAVEPGGFGRLEIEIVVFALADFERAPALETVERGRGRRCQ